MDHPGPAEAERLQGATADQRGAQDPTGGQAGRETGQGERQRKLQHLLGNAVCCSVNSLRES